MAVRRLLADAVESGSAEEHLAHLMREASQVRPAPLRKHAVRSQIEAAARTSVPWMSGTVFFALATGGVALAAGTVHLWRDHGVQTMRIESSPPRDMGPGIAGSAGPARSNTPDPGSDEAISARSPEALAAPWASVESPTPWLSASQGGTVQGPRARGMRVAVPRKGASHAAAPADTGGTLAQADGDDPSPVLAAVRELRLHGDAVQAGALLDRYLKAHPSGVSSEDALALSIEAADARHDPLAAASYGTRYLAQFPAGRFRALALEATRRADH